MTNEMHNSYNQFLFHSFLSAVHVSNESSLHHQEHITQFGTIGTIVQACTVLHSTIVQACTIVPIVLCNTVYYAVLLMMND